MPYPTDVLFKPVGQSVGIQPIDESSATANHPIGMVAPAKCVTYGQAEFIYLPGVASTARGDLVAYTSTSPGSTTRAVLASRGPTAVAMSANTAGRFGWYCIQGTVPMSAASAGAESAVYATATAGQAGSASGTLVDGARWVSALNVDFATVKLTSPSIPEPSAAGASLGGTNTFTGTNTFNNSISLPRTDTSGTPGNATANTARGRSAILGDNTAVAVTITNSLVTANSQILISPVGGGVNLRTWNVQPAAGSFTWTVNAASTQAIVFDWAVIN